MYEPTREELKNRRFDDLRVKIGLTALDRMKKLNMTLDELSIKSNIEVKTLFLILGGSHLDITLKEITELENSLDIKLII